MKNIRVLSTDKPSKLFFEHGVSLIDGTHDESFIEDDDLIEYIKKKYKKYDKRKG